jgi:fatty-acyl-CoA synthase
MPLEAKDEWIDRDFVALHAKMRPDQTVCLAFATGDRLTYAGLHERANRAAAVIRSMAGVEVRGQPVAILARNSIDFLAFVVACYRLGAVLHPLNWRLSASELEFLVNDARPVLAIYEEEFGPALLSALQSVPEVRSATLDAFRAEMDQVGTQPYTPQAMGPDAPFVLLYTSGTTGKPKGAIITRANAFWQSFNFSSVADVDSKSVLLCDSPMFHTVGLIAVSWTTLQKGAMFAISDRFIPADTIARLLDEDLDGEGRGATHYFGVPQIARMLLDEPSYKPRALNRLTGFFLGGAPSPPEMIERMVKDRVRVANGFGMSETGTIAHVPRILDVIAANPASCGQPAPAMQVKILDGEGQELPYGTAGEICLCGPAVTAGYWRRPEATQSGFFPGGWFRSGDIGMIDPVTGFLSVLDRSKDMYISGGENVYPAEVEDAILRIPGVGDAAVIGVPDERWGEVGCAYIVLKPDITLQADAVIKACGQWLATYKRPKHVRFIEAIPRNAAGKPQKQVLRERGL